MSFSVSRDFPAASVSPVIAVMVRSNWSIVSIRPNAESIELLIVSKAFDASAVIPMAVAILLIDSAALDAPPLISDIPLLNPLVSRVVLMITLPSAMLNPPYAGKSSAHGHYLTCFPSFTFISNVLLQCRLLHLTSRPEASALSSITTLTGQPQYGHLTFVFIESPQVFVHISAFLQDAREFVFRLEFCFRPWQRIDPLQLFQPIAFFV